MELLKEAGDRVIEFHVHGVRWDGKRLEDHLSLAANDCIDYPRIVRFVKERHITAPWVFEMQYELDGTRAVAAACCEARDFLTKCWEGKNERELEG